MDELKFKKCIPCKKGTAALKEKEINLLLQKIDSWDLNENIHLNKTFLFPDFKSALSFVNKVGELSEIENHHPNIIISWGKVEISIWTHVINGLHKNDFILASKIDVLYH